MRRSFLTDALVVLVCLALGLGLLVTLNPSADASRALPPHLEPEAHVSTEPEGFSEQPERAEVRTHRRHLARPIVRLEKPPFYLARDGAAERDAFYAMPCDGCRVMSDFRDQRRRGRHRALDLNIDDDHFGLGAPVHAIGRSRVVEVGTTESDPRQFGRPLESEGRVRRGGRYLPTFEDREPYGRVYYFTRTYGSWRSGNVIVTEMLEGPLAGDEVRYMHLGAVHPSVRAGAIVERGQEIGLLGGSAVMTDAPHLHIDASRRGTRLDLSEWVGLEPDDRIRRRYDTELDVVAMLPEAKASERRAKGLRPK
jgi:murein DD-endopeptidase MepM/ murein hydrolase activator NlpD